MAEKLSGSTRVGIVGLVFGAVAVILPLLVLLIASLPGQEAFGWMIIVTLPVTLALAVIGLIISVIGIITGRRSRPVVAILGAALNAVILLLVYLLTTGAFS
ncbi:hypothetical protein [Herbiconiux liukaitaii]|uniref:hypothetical protein n=1 Tax=Herbiconiux liukaitaii TaxID=3342799 RepID=UPI0035B6D7F6